MTRKRAIVSGIFALVALCALPARAHNGPPFPILENRRMGGWLVSLWTHPDIGTGAFFVFLEAAAGTNVAGDVRFHIGIQPESKRLPEVVYAMNREEDHGQVQYKALVDFDRDDFFRVRLVLEDSQGQTEALSRVEATPVGFGRWDLLFYLLPFLAIAFLWVRGITRKRNRTRRPQAA
jgi:hypothetical protein